MEQQDWSAVGHAVTARLSERGMTMTDLANRSGVALTTVREIAHASSTRQRQPRVLTAISTALGWPEDRLVRVLRGAAAGDLDGPPELDGIRGEVAELRARVEALEKHAASS